MPSIPKPFSLNLGPGNAQTIITGSGTISGTNIVLSSSGGGISYPVGSIITTPQMKGQGVLFSSKSDNWSTDPKLYAGLNAVFNFNFDPCPLNPTFDGLAIDWMGNVFVNPPYSNTKAFLSKAIDEKKKGKVNQIVLLLPARTDTRWFQDMLYPNAATITFVKGRLKFGGSKTSAPFPSLIATLFPLDIVAQGAYLQSLGKLITL